MVNNYYFQDDKPAGEGDEEVVEEGGSDEAAV